MPSILSISGLSKTYKTGFSALKNIDLEIPKGEIFALLGPNGAGKTTLISIICGIVTKSSGQVLVGGHDNVSDYRAARAMIGLVPQELSLPIFDKVWDTIAFSRRLFGKPRNDALLEKILKQLSLWDKKDEKIMTLSGGMKRRVLIAKALAHEPQVLFLDEPTAGVDVELRKDMWNVVRELRENGTTIILTTHYIEEAEEMADRVGVISKGELILVERKSALMEKMGQKHLNVMLEKPLAKLPKKVADLGFNLASNGKSLTYLYDSKHERPDVAKLLAALATAKIGYTDLSTQQSSLEEIFLGLVKQ
ncbi:ABC transporter ATP-binding protein [Aestuariivirga litoralis]|uniref:ABC transporter ATP-binding protein n=1 Tax=Aestuariivirga litoralis TaxID=2650924 RepID=UPI0018C5E014|nr:ABC transporter ATP-binding protein [Aestuariivirga litoralis]MBG1230979.1 ABC transporter ATP-binding protein [Aestuariivirga litoralis]